MAEKGIATVPSTDVPKRCNDGISGRIWALGDTHRSSDMGTEGHTSGAETHVQLAEVLHHLSYHPWWKIALQTLPRDDTE